MSHATPLRHTDHEGWPDESERIAQIAERIGLQLMPWQARAFAVATQHDGTAYRHPVVVCSVPRQSGKSTMLQLLVLDRLVHGSLADRRWEAGLTAQTRGDAARFLVDWGEHRDAFPGMVVHRGVGNELLKLDGNSIRGYAPVPESVHGRTLAGFLWDETWSVDRERGREILQAAAPSMVTRPDRQIWMVSTAGTSESLFLREWVERAAAGEGACLIEYGAPEGADIEHPASWADWHPAYGHTQDAEGIRQARALFADDEAGFRRAYCNQWPEAQGTTGAIDPQAWNALADPDADMPERGGAVFAVDVDPYGLSASIAAAWPTEQGVHVELADMRDGVHWLQARVPELLERHGGKAVWSQDYGPVVATLDALERARVRVERIRARDASAAVQGFLTAVAEGSLRHSGQEAMSRSALAVGTRPYGDGVQWQRRNAGATSPITAATWAAWGAARVKRRTGPLRIVTLGA